MDARDENGKFLPGNNANPSGRPKKQNALTEILRKIGDEPLDETGRTRKQELARILWGKALDDQDMPAIKYIYDRIDGLPIAKQEITGDDGGPVGFRFVDPPKPSDSE